MTCALKCFSLFFFFFQKPSVLWSARNRNVSCLKIDIASVWHKLQILLDQSRRELQAIFPCGRLLSPPFLLSCLCVCPTFTVLRHLEKWWTSFLSPSRLSLVSLFSLWLSDPKQSQSQTHSFVPALYRTSYHRLPTIFLFVFPAPFSPRGGVSIKSWQEPCTIRILKADEFTFLVYPIFPLLLCAGDAGRA